MHARDVLRAARARTTCCSAFPRRRGQRVLRVRRRELQRDARAGVDAALDRQGVGLRLGHGLRRRHRAAARARLRPTRRRPVRRDRRRGPRRTRHDARLGDLVAACSRCRCSGVPESAAGAATRARVGSSRRTRGSAATSPGSGANCADTVWFLLASAVFRDGLAGVFTFGAVLAASVFGFSAGEVIIFAIAANVVAGISTIVASARFDDRLGANRDHHRARRTGGRRPPGLLPARRGQARVLDLGPRALALRRARPVGRRSRSSPESCPPVARARCSASTRRPVARRASSRRLLWALFVTIFGAHVLRHPRHRDRARGRPRAHAPREGAGRSSLTAPRGCRDPAHPLGFRPWNAAARRARPSSC